MNYVKSFDLFGVPATQIPATPGSGAPTTATEGAVGCLYMDTDTGNLYKCTAATDGAYTWVEAGNGSGGLDLENLTMEVTGVDGGNQLSLSDGTTTKTALIPAVAADADDIQVAVDSYLTEHPVEDGKDGADGVTPHIGDNGNWWIGEEDTGVSAGGTVKSVNGNAPDENGNVEIESGGVYVGSGDMPDGYNIQIDPTVKTNTVLTINGIAPDETGNVEITIPDIPDTEVEIPTVLPNPHALTLTGAVEATYDGSKAVSVEIPTDGGGSEWTLLHDITLEEEVSTISIDTGNAKEVAFWFNGRINDADDSLSNGNASSMIRINAADNLHKVWQGNQLYIRGAGAAFSTLYYAKVYGGRISGFVNTHSNASGSGVYGSFGGNVAGDAITHFYLSLVTSGHLFKAGSTVQVYGR